MHSLRLNTFNFVLIHGAGHRPEHWQYLADALENNHWQDNQNLLGHWEYKSIVPELPCDDANKTLADDVTAIEEAIGNESNLVITAHSRGFEPVPDLLTRLDHHRVAAVIAINSGGPHCYTLPGERAGTRENSRYHPRLRNYIHRISSNMFSYDPSVKEVFYPNADDERANEAVALLRPQRDPEARPDALPSMPQTIPTYLIRSIHDRLLNITREKQVAETYMHAEVVDIPGDHTPQISREKYLASLLITLAHEGHAQAYTKAIASHEASLANIAH